MRRKSETRQGRTTKMIEDQTPEWVKSMHAFREANGYFRPADVYRVLGDQGKSVGRPLISNLVAAGIKPR
jgi:hypothetical protein